MRLVRFIQLLFLTGVCVNGLCQSNAPNSSSRPSRTAVSAPAALSSGIKISYVRTREAVAPVSDAAVFDTAGYRRARQTTQYLDGLGRPLQSVVKQATPGLKDLVAPVVYDAYGREQYRYLPYGSTDNSGGFKLDAFGLQATFMGSQYSGESLYYSENQYENAPLNRVLKTLPAGNSWGGASDKGVAISYLLNETTDSVRIWTIGYDTLTYSGDAGTNIPSTSSMYSAGQLQETHTTDENGKQVVEYKDKDGHVVLKKVQTIASPSEGPYGWLCTYYIYDDFGLLRFVLQPDAVEYLAANSWVLSSSTVIQEQCFRYEYDARKRMVAKKVPGAGWVYLVYDQRDRLAFTQDARMRAGNQWLTTIYDDQNRPLSTGMISYSGNRGALQWLINSLYDAATATTVAVNFYAPDLLSVDERETGKAAYRAVTEIDFTGEFVSEDTANFETYLGAAIVSTTNILVNYNPLPPGDTLIGLTVNYYDDYAFTSKSYNTSNNSYVDDGGNAYPETLPSLKSLLTRGTLTGSKVRILSNPGDLSGGTWLETVDFYDDKGRVIQTQAENYKSGNDITTQRYDFTGKPITSYHVHNNPVLPTIVKAKTNLLYDQAGRLLSVSKTLNNDATTTRLLARNEYDELGQLLNKQLGQIAYGNTTEMELQHFDYNIRGWLRGINKGYSDATGTAAWFGMELNYDYGFQNNQFNGNIAGVQWRSKGDGKQRAFGYGYDAANRLLAADFNQYTSSSWNKTAGLDFSVLMGDGLNASAAYDANGNIQSMQQKGWYAGSSVALDNMSYSYISNTNKVDYVTDAVTVDHKTGDFTDGNTSGSDYAYDDNGNLNQDKNKSIRSITYNHLNLPYLVTVTGKGTIQYIYDALGNKLEKISTDSFPSKTTRTTYLNGYVYQNDTLQFIAHEEGRIRIKPNNIFAYDYFVKDHLGNTRMVLTEQIDTAYYPAATLETASIDNEKLYYTIPDASGVRVNRSSVTGYPTNDTYTSPNDYIHKLNGSGTKVGSSITLRVMSGDKVNIHASSWYTLNSVTPGTPVNPLTDLIAALAGGVSKATNGKAVSSALISSGELSPGMTDMLGTETYNSARPKAYLSWVLFDEQFKFVSGSSGFDQVGADNESSVHSHDVTNLPITSNGYLYVYVSNETPNVDVYFDNLKVTHITGPLLEETHYYPFGLTMAGISSKAAGKLENKFKYNGIEFNDDLGLNTYDAFYRNLDPQTGRFWQIDPKVDAGYESWSPYVSMYNNPIRFSDPLGDEGDDGGIFSWQNFKENMTNNFNKVVGVVAQGISNLKDNIDNGRTLPQQLAKDFHENPLSAITGIGALEARAVPFIAKEVQLLSTEASAVKAEVSGEKTFQTYIKEHPTESPYSGRTSGRGAPEENVAKRDANHHMNAKGYGSAKLDKTSTNSDAIRGREQLNIVKHGGAKSVGGTSGNAVNGISDKNPKKAQYIEAAKKEFDKKQ